MADEELTPRTMPPWLQLANNQWEQGAEFTDLPVILTNEKPRKLLKPEVVNGVLEVGSVIESFD
jgi:hypothetical protein